MTSYLDHLKSGATHLCQAWAITRKDGDVLGFTDHDRDLVFDGITFAAGAGMTGFAVSQSTGLSVDNSEAQGVLSAGSIRAEDLTAGQYDGAELRIWSVVWDAPELRQLQFRGTIGAVRRSGAAFAAELRGLTEALNQPGGRVFTRMGSAVPGGLLPQASEAGPNAYVGLADIVEVDGARLQLTGLDSFAEGWFQHGRLEVLSGELAGLFASVKAHEGDTLQMWSPLDLRPGDKIRVVAGCDGRFETYRDKFGNAADFDGFPHIPSEDWLMSVPRAGEVNDGGSLFR